jgi:hypothetical protein
MLGRYLKRLFVALDILINVLRGGELETVSSSCGKRLVATPCRLCGALCRFIETSFDGRWLGHCANNRREPYQ